MFPISVFNGTNLFDALDVFQEMDNIFNGRKSDGFLKSGLRKFIRNPHNLYVQKDKDGNIESYKLSVVYTPFKAKDCSVTIDADNVLKITMGTENKEKDKDLVWCGISSRQEIYEIPLSDSIDRKACTVKADEGILNITLPVKKTEPKREDSYKLEIQ